jgi:hypothetical protein
MKKFLLAPVAVLLGLTVTGAANAHEPRFAHGHGHVAVGRPYFHDHGVHFAGGYYYRGFDHHHWEHRVWDGHYGRYQYWDPYLSCYFYWDAGRDCWYPVGY